MKRNINRGTCSTCSTYNTCNIYSIYRTRGYRIYPQNYPSTCCEYKPRKKKYKIGRVNYKTENKKYAMTTIHTLLRKLYESSIKYMKEGNLLSLCNRQTLEEHEATILIEKNDEGYTIYINLDGKDILTSYPSTLQNFGLFVYNLPEEDKKRILNIISDYRMIYERAEEWQQNLIDMLAYTSFHIDGDSYKTQVISDLSEQMGITATKLHKIIEYRREYLFH